MKERIDALIKDADYLDFWNGLLESEPFKTTARLCFMERDFETGAKNENKGTVCYKALWRDGFKTLYEKNEIDGRYILIPEHFKIHRVFKEYPDLQYFIDPAKIDTRRRGKWFWPFTCGAVKIEISDKGVNVTKPDVNPELGERARKAIRKQLDAIYYDERQALKGQPFPKDPITKAGESDRKRRKNPAMKEKENLLKRVSRVFCNYPEGEQFLKALIKNGSYAKERPKEYRIDLSAIMEIPLPEETSERLSKKLEGVLEKLRAEYGSVATYDKKTKSLVLLI